MIKNFKVDVLLNYLPVVMTIDDIIMKFGHYPSITYHNDDLPFYNKGIRKTDVGKHILSKSINIHMLISVINRGAYI
mgnify:CR=1 FL=1